MGYLGENWRSLRGVLGAERASRREVRREAELAAEAWHGLEALEARVLLSTTYVLTELGGVAGATFAFDINNAGVVVGATADEQDNQSAAQWVDGQLQAVPSLTETGQSAAIAINDDGVIAGNSQIGEEIHAFRADGNNVVDLGALSGGFSSANSINDRGFVVGNSVLEEEGFPPHAFVYRGGLIDLGTLIEDGVSNATDINNSNVIVGDASVRVNNSPFTHAFMTDQNGNLVDLMGDSVAANGTATAISDLGVVVGSREVNNVELAHIFTTGDDTSLGTLENKVISRALDINAAGEIVGVAADTPTQTGDDVNPVAFVWDGQAMFDLNTLIAQGGEGWTLQYATGINDAGQIVGYGINNDQQRAFLLTPIQGPEPQATLQVDNVFGPGQQNATLTVTYTDDVGVDFETIDSQDIEVTLPDNTTVLATLVSTEPSADAESIVATYTLAAPNGEFTANDEGVYAVRLQGNQIGDVENPQNFALARTLGTFNVDIDNTPPTAQITDEPNPQVGETGGTITITYIDETAVDISSIDANDITITAPNGTTTLTITGVEVDLDEDGSPAAATYTFTAPAGTFELGDIGTYNVTINEGEVVDTAGNPIAAGQLGTFDVGVVDDRTERQFGQGADAGRRLVVTDADGTRITFILQGPGVATLIGDDGDESFDLVLNGTTNRSNLRVRTDRGGDGEARLGVVTVNGSLNSFQGNTTDLDGSLTVSETVSSIRLDDIRAADTTDQDTISIGGQGAAANNRVRLRFDEVADLDIVSAIGIQQLRVNTWTDGAEETAADTVTAPWIQQVRATGNFQAGLLLSGEGARQNRTLGNARINGDLTEASWVITTGNVGNVRADGSVDQFALAATAGNIQAFRGGSVGDATVTAVTGTINNIRAEQWDDGAITADTIRNIRISGNNRNNVRGDFGADVSITGGGQRLNNLQVAGLVDDVDIRTAGSIGGVSVGAIRNSDLFAGVDAGVDDRLPNLNQIGEQSINSFRMTGNFNDTGNELGGFRFVDSNVAASTIAQIRLRDVDRTSGDDTFGFASERVNQYQRAESGGPNVRLRNLRAPEDAGDYDQPAQGNYVLRIVGENVDTQGPTAVLVAENVTEEGITVLTFDVTYTDDEAVDASTIGDGDVRVIGPNGFSVLATLVSVEPDSNAGTVTATYQVAKEDQSAFTEGPDEGAYVVVVQANEVADVSGNFAQAGDLGFFVVDIGADDAPPTATLQAEDVTQPGSQTLTVTYTAAEGRVINVETLDSSDLIVEDEQGNELSVTFVGSEPSEDAQTVVATYTVVPADNSFDADDAGIYTVSVAANQVQDDAGDSVLPANLGTFTVAIDGGGEDTTAPTGGLTTTAITPAQDDPTGTITVEFSDDVAIDVSSIDTGDVTITAPDGTTTLNVTGVSVDTATDGTPVSATFTFDAPGGTFDAADEGTYTVALAGDGVVDTSGNAVAALDPNTFTVTIGGGGDTAAPTATLTSGPTVTTDGTTGTVVVTYADDTAVDISDIDPADITITAPDGTTTLNVTGVTVDVAADGTPVSATYTFDAPGGTWDAADEGEYTVTINADQVTDTSENPVPAGSLGTFAIDLTAPAATLTTTPAPAAGEIESTIAVTYTDNVAIDVSDLDSTDIVVVGPDGVTELPVTFVSVDVNEDGTPRTATYVLTAPGGFWDAADNGTYTIRVVANEVSDTSENFVPAGDLGTFVVALA